MLWIRLHLHDEILGLAPSIVAQSRLFKKAQCGKTMKEKRQAGKPIGPAQVVEIGVHQPVTSRMRPPKNSNCQKHEQR